MPSFKTMLPWLTEDHRGPVRDGMQWHLTRAGIVVFGETDARRTVGRPLTATRVLTLWGDEIRAAATAYGVPIELIVMTICGESMVHGSSTSKTTAEQARREEPGYQGDDATPGRISLGLMQTLISTARDALHDPHISAAELTTPAISIRAGTAYIAQQSGHTRYDPPLVAAAYNAGGLYPDHMAANPWKLRCYPLGSGRYITRAVEWFGDAMEVCARPGAAGEAPSLAVALRGAA